MRTFTEFLERLIIDQGSQLNLAAAAAIDPAKISRFRSDQNGLSRVEVDKILEVGGAAIVMRREIEDQDKMLEYLASLWLRERRKSKEGKA
jgi:hypothetical protein